MKDLLFGSHIYNIEYEDGLLIWQDGRLLATGSRDRYLMLLDLTKYDSSRPETKRDMKLHCINKAHNVSVTVKSKNMKFAVHISRTPRVN